MIIGGHSLLGIDARSFELQKEFDRIKDEVRSHAPDRDTRLLVIRMDGPGEDGFGSNEPGVADASADRA